MSACRSSYDNEARSTVVYVSSQRVIAFATGKGGAGKTSCAANVAGLAAAAGWRTLSIDLDPQGNLGHDLGYAWTGQSDGGAHIVSALMGGTELRPVLNDVRPRLDVICGGNRLDDMEDMIAGRERRGEGGVTLLRDALAPLAVDYDLVVIDTPPSRRSALVLLALTAARWIVAPTKSDRSSIEGLRKLGEQADLVRRNNPDLELLGSVLFGVGSAATVIRDNAAQDVEAVLGGAAPRFNAIIRHAEAPATDAREKGRLIHELAEVVHDAEPYWKALKEGRRPVRVPGTAPALAEDYVLLTQEILAGIAPDPALEEPA